ncbi:MAG: hypothetical protein K2Q06_05525, partial [Parvularculaceae bacterium]|nr:hypothetical protein [Parvularculaceae bacterium]
VAHLGLGLVALGAVGAGAWKSETIQYVDKGQSIAVAGRTAKLVDVVEGKGPNYVYERGEFAVTGPRGEVSRLAAERRFYPVRGMQTTEAGYATGPLGDVYVSIGERKEGKGWVVRLWRHPLVSWLWLGIALTAFGGFLALAPAPKRRTAAVRAAAPAMAE